MARREYLSADERARFDRPPALSPAHRSILLDLPPWAEAYLSTSQSPRNRVGFVLQLGYFRILTRFFRVEQFDALLIDWLRVELRLGAQPIQLTRYARSRTAYRHRETILHHLGYQLFEETHRRALMVEASQLAHQQTRPALMLDALAAYLREHRVEVPPYSTLRTVLTAALDEFETQLQATIEHNLDDHDRTLLDELLEKEDAPESLGAVAAPPHRYRLTQLKRISQSMQPAQIKERVSQFTQLKQLFTRLAPLVSRLSLADETIRYYAQYVLDTQSSTLALRTHERYLRLIAFIVHQYLSVGDALILTLRHAVTATLNDCERTLKEEQFKNRYATAQLVHQITRRSDAHIETLSEIQRIVEQAELDDGQKVERIRQSLGKKRMTADQLKTDKERLGDLKTVNQAVHERDDFYAGLEAQSLRLQTRVAGIVQTLVFDEEASHPHILAAVQYVQQRAGELSATSGLPVDFLDMAERQHIYTPTGKLRVSLYKALLYWKVRDHLRDGSLNVLSSYEHRAFEEYLIPRSQWKAAREQYLQRANLERYAQAETMLASFNERLNAQFQTTNEGLATNTQVFFDKANHWHLHRYRAAETESVGNASSLYPTNRVIALRDVLEDVHELTGFLDVFAHKGFIQKPTRPDTRLLLAAVIGYGENIGIRKMGLISRHISINALETVATHYFSPEMVLRANDVIVERSSALPLADLFRRQEGFIHTGSDGQKYDVSVPSLRASASFKYFGNGEGITIYSHLDEAGHLIYSTAFSAADREAPYMLDAITYNEVITPNAHSTDQHGFSEPVFGVTGLIGVEFRPRFASIHRQQLYSLDAVSTYKELGYKISPVARIDYDNLVGQWDEVLRFVASIKLGHAKASQLFKRLNSYDRQHPLYRALRDLGRLFKTEYILRYINDTELRETVEGTLTRVEHANRFAKAVNWGGNQAFGWLTYSDQLVAEGCKRLIMNAINYWNLLYLTERLGELEHSSDRQALLQTILRSNTHTWHHINLQGEYDFSEGLPRTTRFDVDRLMNVPLRRSKASTASLNLHSK